MLVASEEPEKNNGMVLVSSAVHQRQLIPDPRPPVPQQHVLLKQDPSIRQHAPRRPLLLGRQRRQLLRRQAPRLLDWTELPEWQKEDNSFVETGYRPSDGSVLSCVGSWFYLHNESGAFYHLGSVLMPRAFETLKTSAAIARLFVFQIL